MRVQVYVYDLTRGLAATLSPMLLGTRIEGVWHTGVVTDGREEIFFGYGINRTRAGTTMFGQPHHILDIGTSEIPQEMLDDLISDLRPRFMPEHYNLLFHNCNTFSNELAQLLTGEGLPDYITNQAEVVFNTPFGEAIMPMVLAMEGVTGRATASGLAQPEAASTSAAAAATPAAASAPPAAPSAGAEQPAGAAASAASSAAANAGMEATAQAAQAAADAAATSTAAIEHRTAAAAAGMAAAARAAEAAAAAAGSGDMQIDSSDGAAVTAVGKVTEGVEALHLTANSRAAGASS